MWRKRSRQCRRRREERRLRPHRRGGFAAVTAMTTETKTVQTIETAEPTAALIDLRGVSLWFEDLHVLDGISLSVAVGEFIAIVGPSGCGKSTLLRVAGGLLPPDAGEARVGGRPSSVARRDG